MSENPLRFDPSWFQLTIDVLDRHGARGFEPESPSDYSELDRWHAGRAIFRLLPASALRMRPGSGFRPLIHRHLSTLGLASTPRAELVLKSVAEQLINTNAEICLQFGRKPKKKMGISHIRASRKYEALSRRQRDRCSTCGLLLDTADSVELDHVIPFSLVGDVSDGANWRILCGRCNLGKHSFISSWLAADSWGWISDNGHLAATHSASRRTRYSVLASRGRCEFAGCDATPRTSELRVEPRLGDAFWTAQNLRVLCAQH